MVLHPPLLAPLARGLAAVGSSPLLLGATFLGVLAVWAVYSSAGLIRVTSPGVMAQLMAIPPIHSAFDANFFGVSTVVFSPTTTLTLTAGLLLVRTALVAFMLGLILEHLEGAPGEGARSLLARAAGLALSAYRTLLALEAAFLVIMIGLPILLGPFLGPLGIAITFIAPTFFLVFAPIAAVREHTGVRQSLRLSMKAARLRGSQHMILVFAYVLGVLALFILTQGGIDNPVTPTILVWAYALFVNVLHTSVFAAMAYRWLLIREDVIRIAAEAPVRPQRTRPRSLRA